MLSNSSPTILQIAVDSEPPFDGIDPEIILPLLKALPANDCTNGKKFWSTFKKWSSLSHDQKNKATVFWKRNISQSVRERLLTISRQQIVAEVADETVRQAITTKEDLARLLHLRVDPGAAADWTAALREKTRAQLDVVNSGEQAADADPYNRLAEKFNNYGTYIYQNACIIPNRLTSAGTYNAAPFMSKIAEYCHDFNPTAADRPNRDGGWIRAKYKELKGKISICFNNYHKSGQQVSILH